MEAIVIGNEKFKAEISPYGAELQQLTRLTDGKNYIWTPIEMFWNRRSPNLFPIVGRLKNNQYLYNGVTYKLDQHGFARNSYFELISQKSNGVILKLKSNSSSMINYPFDFSLTMQF
ncbi:MAG: aldose 1-epimerase family protein, partial [Bacteroidia bacterium]